MLEVFDKVSWISRVGRLVTRIWMCPIPPF
jgi:hypothetical protein